MMAHSDYSAWFGLWSSAS